MSLRRVAAVFSAAFFAASAFGSQSVPALFVAEPKVQEFSGRMIARPWQPDVLLARTGSPAAAAAVRGQAQRLVRGLTINYVPETDEYIIRVPRGDNENTLAQRLMESRAFQYVEPDWIVYPVNTVPNDPLYGQQWHHPKINGPQAWSLFRGNNTITVAICDTGVRLDHVDLAPLLVPGYNAVDQLPQQNGGQVNDIHGHGTHVAGTAAASTNNGMGVAGVGWNFRIMPVRVSNSSGGGSSIATLTHAGRWAADNGARIINTSYSGVSSSSVQTTGEYIKNTRNGLYIWAAGNSNQNMSGFDHPDVTIVGATTTSDTKASFSNYGLALDVFAPGENIYATAYNGSNSYTTMSGTSMASPVASGVAAMIMASNPSLSSQQVETILYTSCFDLGTPGNDNYWGWGRVDLLAALRQSYFNFPFFANSYAMFRGAHVGGQVSHLSQSNNQYMRFDNTVFTESRSPMIGVELDLRTTLLATHTLELTVEAGANQNGIQQRMELWNNASQQWIQVDQRLLQVADSTATINISNAQPYVQSGTGRVLLRLVYDQVMPGIMALSEVRLDHVAVKTMPTP
jgi:hypothetical protein